MKEITIEEMGKWSDEATETWVANGNYEKASDEIKKAYDDLKAKVK